MINDNAITVSNIYKKFSIYHENRSSMYGYLTSVINRKKSFDELVVLDDISFSVKKGEMLGIIGFNGSGKTTLLKIIAKIYTPDKGSVTTNGTITPLLELGTGFNRELSARENIITYGVILGFTKNEMVEKIKEITRFAELEKFLDTKVKNFSSGMNARLAFSTAIQVDPDILLLDEIFSVGDLLFREKSFNALMDFRKKGKTIVFVSHQIDQVASLCDKVMWLHDGKIREYGEPYDVIKKYRSFAADKSH
jgi:ABC-type polysaccharide/polyol phosphate transport system ATPase subunit